MTYRIVVVARTNSILRGLPEAMAGDATVQLFDSANDALWAISTEPPDLVLSELELDEMSGLDLAEIVPNFDPHTRVVLWGAGVSNTDRERAQAAGVSTVLSGDVSLDTVRAAVNRALDVPRSEPTPVAPPTPAPATMHAAAETARSEPPALAAKKETPAPPPADTTPPRAFTPARVVLPSRAEREAAERAAREAAEREAAERAAREAAAREATHHRGGLAARSRAAAERRTSAPPPAAASPATSEPPLGWRSDGRNLIVTEQNIAAIRSIMSQLGQDLGTQSIMLTDRAGMILVETGDKGNLPLMIVLPLLSTGFSTTGEVARQLREEDATSVYIHEGVNIDLYCFDVAQRFLLVLVFNKRVASSKIGAVWVNAKRAIRELRDVLARSS
ncbi:response regulator [Chloroflexus sp.]|uniref:response regulator n=1 Tax=Chloroflexus sp. TaxID=1904827 RepID=UPI002ACECA5A|nr:response regulator [Chloroflexus sp.]